MENIFNEFKDRVGELLNGIVRRFEKGDLVIDLGRVEAVLHHKELAPREAVLHSILREGVDAEEFVRNS